MMQNVYVIKVKTKPPLSSLYPSERRYSASTVGGLSFVHFGLGALSLLLGSLALSLQGPVLSVACLISFVTGLLAWRRWYIDRNIAIFFYGSLFSLIAAILCFIATVFDIAAAVENRDSFWSILKQRDHLELEEYLGNDILLNKTMSFNEDAFNLSRINDQTSRVHFYAPTPGITFDNMSNISGYILRTSTTDSEEIDVGNSSRMLADVNFGNGGTSLDLQNITGKSLGITRNKVMSLGHDDHVKSSHSKILLTVNVLVASLLEAFWSALSARIALRGMMNRLPEGSYVNGATGNTKSERARAGKRKPPAPRPDILDHDRRLSESLQNLTTMHGLRNSGPRLPLPESSREFRERVERFLANQAAHRVVEEPCS
ncbi:uncharacterized protein LOC108633001 [Ceratina calcarata]|uniref:Uncharacterized protein LOC108633001 n=1 Tax=Ceratina calcarata TaxID=156304 RepID=A0AAJ7JH74_9HYME|nr:uncharacterized protein LOC108633001 [Ceratina calcarata]